MSGRDNLLKKLKKRDYRIAYVGEHVRRWIAYQIRALREAPERKWKQGELSARMGKPQSVVSRLEDPSYGKMTVQTLLEVAQAFDVALIIKFVSYPRFIRETDDLSSGAMAVPDFENSKNDIRLNISNISSADNKKYQSMLFLPKVDTSYYARIYIQEESIYKAQIPATKGLFEERRGELMHG